MVAAEPQELVPLADVLGARADASLPVRWNRVGRLDGRPVVLTANGAGCQNAARAVQEVCARGPVGGIVSTGWCGALAPELGSGQIIMADKVICTRTSAGFAAAVPKGGAAVRGSLLTLDRFVVSAGEKRALAQTGAIAVDMESAGVAAVAQQRRLPFYCLRVVSDTAGRSFRLDFNQARQPDGSFSRVRMAVMAGRRPAAWRELLSWWRDARQAARRLAIYLGGCRFEV